MDANAKNKDEEKYKTYRKYYKKVINEAQKSYFSDLFDTKANTVKQLWNNLASVASLSKSKNKSNINELLININRITDPKMISDLFNNYLSGRVRVW